MSSFSGGDDEPSPAEWAVTALSVAVTLLLFGYVAWHAAATPAHVPPEATVTDTETASDGRLLVTTTLHNPGRPGLESVTVSVDCGDAPITFQHVPTDARLTGTVVCPAGASDPSASVRNWVESQGSRST